MSWSQASVVSNECSQINGLKWDGLDSDGTAAVTSRRHMKLQDHWYKIRVANLSYLKPDVEILDFLTHLAFLKAKKR